MNGAGEAALNDIPVCGTCSAQLMFTQPDQLMCGESVFPPFGLEKTLKYLTLKPVAHRELL